MLLDILYLLNFNINIYNFEDDIDIIKNIYEKAKKIGLLENNNKIILDINEIPNNNIERGRISGRRRGRGRDEVRGRIRNIRGRGRGRRG